MADPERFDADPDPTFHADADPNFFLQNLKKIFTGNFLSKNYLIDKKNADISFDYGEGLKTWD